MKALTTAQAAQVNARLDELTEELRAVRKDFDDYIEWRNEQARSFAAEAGIPVRGPDGEPEPAAPVLSVVR
jgi:hypothetical protein